MTSEGWLRYYTSGFSLEIAWRVTAGEVVVLYGPSGVGKTTTLKAIAGLLRPQEGYLALGGETVFDSRTGRWVPPHHRKVGYVPQEMRLFPHLSVGDNIAFGLARWWSREERRRRVAELVEAFSLEGLEARWPWQLSGGQQQRVSLARALAPRPRLLLLDEPLVALDAELRRQVRRELRQSVASWGIPVVLVTHDQEEALALGTRVIVLAEGRVAAEGEPVAVLGRPPRLGVARLLGVENVYQGVVEERQPPDGVMTCRVNGVRVVLPLGESAPGQVVRFGVRASDVLVAVEEPRGLSARNLLLGQVLRLEPEAAGVRVELDCGLPVVAHVTPAAVKKLGLAPERRAWAVIKTSSFFLTHS